MKREGDILKELDRVNTLIQPFRMVYIKGGLSINIDNLDGFTNVYIFDNEDEVFGFIQGYGECFSKILKR